MKQQQVCQQMELIAAVAKDMRDPAAVILLAKDSLQKNALPYVPQQMQEKVQFSLDCIQKNVNRIERVSMNLTDLARSVCGELRPRWQPVCLSEACSQICEQARLFRSGKGISCNLPKQPVVSLMDEYFFDRILLNLLSNAMNACPDGKISVDLKVSVQEILLVVTDNGPGLPSDRLQQPFAPVYRSETAQTKLGLHLCSVLANQMNAVLCAENMPMGGARFILKIPVRSDGQETAFFAADSKQSMQMRRRCVSVEFAGFEKAEI